MNRISAFCARNIRELMRDPLSYIFCVAFPLVMLMIMSVVNTSIPPEAGMTVFRIDKLCPGIAMFGQTFVMLFTAITVAQDRAGSFLVRMYATPMTSKDFTAGYLLPMMIIAAVQAILTFAASLIISLITGTSLDPVGMLITFLTLIPSALMFTALGLLFGTLFNEKAAPGMCSVIISLGSFLGCVFFDAEHTGGVMLDICRCTPFFYCTKSARSALCLDFSAGSYLIPLAVVTACAIVFTTLAAVVFGGKMKADLS
ncbi:MAG: ABC transporter permease [Ruminiclostridium sp.]|nr:ABC transporter permease [Ruminiclostridium sp.]